jgi:Domain of unknown function (DUF4386)
MRLLARSRPPDAQKPIDEHQVQVTAHGDTSLMENEIRSRMLYSRLIGALFLAGFLFYGVGFSLVDSITSEPDFVSTIPEQETVLVLGAFLMLVNIGVDVGKGVLFFPILEGHGKRTALVYLSR